MSTICPHPMMLSLFITLIVLSRFKRFLAGSLVMVTTSALGTEAALELPPPLTLQIMPDVCEMSPALTELSLQDAVHIAFCKSPNVQQASTSVEENIANVDAAHAKYLPNVHANVEGSRIGKHVKYPGHSAGDHDLYAYSGTTRLGLSWLLFDSGQRGARYDNAKAKLTAALYNKLMVNRDQAVTVANNYYKAASTHASATATHAATARAEKSFQIARRLREGGVGSIADELLAKVAWQRSLIDSETKATAAEIAKIALVSAIGLPGQTHVGLSSDIETPTTSRATPIKVGAGNALATNRQHAMPSALSERLIAAVRNHPRLAVARANTKAAQAETVAIQAQHRPTVTLQADRYLSITPPANTVAKQNVNGWSVGLTLHIPIFDGMANRYATDAAQARTRVARETEQAVWIEEELNLLTDFNHMTSATQKSMLIKDAEVSADHAYRSAQIRYQQGVGTAVELLKAQDDFANIQQAAIDVQYELLTVQFRVAVALDTLPPVHTSMH